MLDPRIYRTGLVVTALALVVLAFSLRNQQPGLSSTLAPQAFNGSNVVGTMNAIARDGTRAPGSSGDQALAVQVKNALAGDAGFTVSTDTFQGSTVAGTATLDNVIAVRPGMQPGSVVIAAPRDAPGLAGASGTAMLIELGRDLTGETLHRTVVLASISGSQGGAGVARLARELPGPIDAVVILGDVASANSRQPILVPWASNRTVAPPVLRNTLASALASQTSLQVGSSGLGAQFARLAFPFTLGQQGPLVAEGIPAVELSLSGEAGPASNAPVTSPGRIAGIGQAVLTAISALDTGPTVPAPSAYVLLSGKVVPGATLALFSLALLVPVLMTAVDAVARARRRRHAVLRPLMLLLGAGAPFAAAVVVVLIASALGAMPVAPPGPVGPRAVPAGTAGIEVLVAAGLVALAVAAAGWFAARRWRLIPSGVDRRDAPFARNGSSRHLPARDGSRGRNGSARSRGTSPVDSGGAIAAVIVLLCAVAFAVWLANPFAALLLMPAVHLWLLAINPDLRMPMPVRLALALVGIAPVAAVVVYYANEFGYGAGGLVWEAALLLAGHGVSAVAAIAWSAAIGCLLGVLALIVFTDRGEHSEPAEVTVRGPVTYAGPGSLGGTESALRR
ncbi:MAG: zinc-binding metallopeptidase family protein [Solirubrobacteraceae bacterium]